jgi:hypothetical protein
VPASSKSPFSTDLTAWARSSSARTIEGWVCAEAYGCVLGWVCATPAGLAGPDVCDEGAWDSWRHDTPTANQNPHTTIKASRLDIHFIRFTLGNTPLEQRQKVTEPYLRLLRRSNQGA